MVVQHVLGVADLDFLGVLAGATAAVGEGRQRVLRKVHRLDNVRVVVVPGVSKKDKEENDSSRKSLIYQSAVHTK